MEMINNYKDYDRLTLYVKKNKLREIIEYYQVFDWQLIEQYENNRYEDVMDLTFIRSHKINNKDELQLQQIYMEERLNGLAKLDKTKHTKTTSFGLCFGLIAIALVVAGIMLAIKVDNILAIVCGGVLSFIGCILIIFEIKLLIKRYKHETIMYEQNKKELELQIFTILERVKHLIGGDYVQK